jgi:hypothetical protein
MILAEDISDFQFKSLSRNVAYSGHVLARHHFTGRRRLAILFAFRIWQTQACGAGWRCYTGQTMQRFRESIKGFARPALAALLIAALSLLTVAAPCACLHQRLHNDGCGASGGCVLCMMIQGHLDCPLPPPIQDSFVSVLIGLTPALNSAGILQVDLRLAPTRAPPCC